MTKPWYLSLRSIGLLIVTAGTLIGMSGDPVAASVKEVASIKSMQPAMVRLLPGDYTRWSYTLSVTRTAQLKDWVLRNENMSTAAVMGASGTLCGLLGLYGSPVLAALAAGSCATFIGIYWGALKDAVHHITPSRPRLRIVETCNIFAFPLGGACRVSFQNIPK